MTNSGTQQRPQAMNVLHDNRRRPNRKNKLQDLFSGSKLSHRRLVTNSRPIIGVQNFYYSNSTSLQLQTRTTECRKGTRQKTGVLLDAPGQTTPATISVCITQASNHAALNALRRTHTTLLRVGYSTNKTCTHPQTHLFQLEVDASCCWRSISPAEARPDQLNLRHTQRLHNSHRPCCLHDICINRINSINSTTRRKGGAHLRQLCAGGGTACQVQHVKLTATPRSSTTILIAATACSLTAHHCQRLVAKIVTLHTYNTIQHTTIVSYPIPPPLSSNSKAGQTSMFQHDVSYWALLLQYDINATNTNEKPKEARRRKLRATPNRVCHILSTTLGIKMLARRTCLLWHAGGVGSLILAVNADFPSGKGVALASILASIFTRDWAADAFVACSDNHTRAAKRGNQPHTTVDVQYVHGVCCVPRPSSGRDCIALCCTVQAGVRHGHKKR